MALFDTDILIDVLRDVPGAKTVLKEYSKERNFLNAITAGEILFCMKPDEEEITAKLLNQFIIIPADEELMYDAAGVKHRAKGHALELYDCIIAATAIKHSLTLVTRNGRHYPDRSLKLFIPDY